MSSPSLLRGISRWWEYVRAGSCATVDDGTVDAFLDEEENTVLVSFPRTGSHMLRMVLERYFERPLLPRTFYHPFGTDFLLHHTHDEELDFVHPTVIYLYRNPVDTVFSELRYRERPDPDPAAVEEVARHYGRHLARWLHRETFTRRKTLVAYGEILERPVPTIGRLCEHFGAVVDEARAESAWEWVTKEEVARKTRHDRKVVAGDREAYRQRRQRFRREHAGRIWEVLAGVDARLPDDLSGLRRT